MLLHCKKDTDIRKGRFKVLFVEVSANQEDTKSMGVYMMLLCNQLRQEPQLSNSLIN